MPALSVAELSAAGKFAAIVGTVIPLLEDLVCLVLVLHDHETSVQEQVSSSVAVMLGVGIVGEGEGVVLGRNAPVVHEPLEGKVETVEESVGVDEDTDVVLLQNLREDGGLLP